MSHTACLGRSLSQRNGVHRNGGSARYLGLILTVIILVEFNHSIVLAIRQRSGAIQVRTIVLITIIVLARKLVLLDYSGTSMQTLLGLAGLGFLLGRNPHAISVNFGNFWSGASFSWGAVALVGTAMVGPLFSSDSWNNVTFAAAEVRNPKRNLPLALGLGAGVVSALYIACNFVYLSVLTLGQIQTAPEDRVATAVVSVMFGPVATGIMAAAIMVSTFGCLNGIILSGARVYFTMARDNLFFARAGELNPRTHAPVWALGMQCVWAVLLTLSGQYDDLLAYVIFAVLLFYMLTIGGLFRLRRTRPDLERPYRAVGYPVLPGLYILMAAVIEVLLLVNKPAFTVRGLILVLLGAPVYFLWRRKEGSR